MERCFKVARHDADAIRHYAAVFAPDGWAYIVIFFTQTKRSWYREAMSLPFQLSVNPIL
jgi:hypothetical protein